MRASFIALLVACALTAVSAHYHKVTVHKKPSCLSLAKKYCPGFAQTIVEQTPELAQFLNDSSSVVTVFCPIDAALPDAEIPDGTSIQDVLYYHVTDVAAYKSNQLVKASPISTILDQHTLTVEKVREYKKTHYYVQGDLSVALVTKADISCGAGRLHVIDTVLIPDLTKTSENYVPPCETSPPPVSVASPPCKWSWHAPNPPPVSVASPPCKWTWSASPPPVSVSSPPYCAPVKVSSPPPACYSPPVKVSSPPPVCYSPPPVQVSSPPPVCYSPPPVQVSTPPPVCYSPPHVQVSSPPPVCSPPVTVASPPPYCAPVASCPSIYAQISADANLSVLKLLIDLAGLQSALQDTSVTFTVFAPSNAALQNIGVAAMCADKGNLIATLKNHLAPGVAVFKEQFSDGICLNTLYNKPVCATVAGGNVILRAQGQSACSSIIPKYNVQACNSVIHTIDNVLVPSA